MRTAKTPQRKGHIRPADVEHDEVDRTLLDAHASLMWQVSTRSDDVLSALDDGHWPGPELGRLVDYLFFELLDQASVEDQQFASSPSATYQPDWLAALDRDHARIRALTDTLAQGGHRRDKLELAETVHRLLTELEDHLQREEAFWDELGETDRAHVAHALRVHSPDWFPLTEGELIDLDELPIEDVAPATLERLVRMRPEEELELHSAHDLHAVWLQLNHRDPGGYGWCYLDEGPDRWRVHVTRRALVGSG